MLNTLRVITGLITKLTTMLAVRPDRVGEARARLAALPHHDYLSGSPGTAPGRPSRPWNLGENGSTGRPTIRNLSPD